MKPFDFAGEEEGGGGDLDAAPDTVGMGDDEVLPHRDPTPRGVREKGRVGKGEAEMPGVPVDANPVGVISIEGAGVSEPTTVILEDTDAERMIPLDCDPRVVPEASPESTAVGVLPALPVPPNTIDRGGGGGGGGGALQGKAGSQRGCREGGGGGHQ